MTGVCMSYHFIWTLPRRLHASGPAGSSKRAGTFRTWNACGSFRFWRQKVHQHDSKVLIVYDVVYDVVYDIVYDIVTMLLGSFSLPPGCCISRRCCQATALQSFSDSPPGFLNTLLPLLFCILD